MINIIARKLRSMIFQVFCSKSLIQSLLSTRRIKSSSWLLRFVKGLSTLKVDNSPVAGRRELSLRLMRLFRLPPQADRSRLLKSLEWEKQ